MCKVRTGNAGEMDSDFKSGSQVQLQKVALSKAL